MATEFTGYGLEIKYSTLKKNNEINEQIDKDLKEQIKYINDATSNVPYTIVASNIHLLKDKFYLDGQILTDLIYSNITDETKTTSLINAINEKIRRSNEFRQEEEDKEPELPPTPTSTSTSRSNSVATTNESISSDSTPTTSSKRPARKGLLGFGRFRLGGKSKKSRKSRKSRRTRKSKRSRKSRRGRK